MPVVVSMLRGVNVGAHNRIKMDALRSVYQSLGLKDCQTFIQSGNVVFCSDEKDLAKLRGRIEAAIEKKFGFRPDVILRTAKEMRSVVAGSPFKGRTNIDSSKLLVTFLAERPEAGAKKEFMKIKSDSEEMHLNGRELYIYFSEGMARPRIAWMSVAKTLGTTGTGRNWNTVLKLLEMAERLEASGQSIANGKIRP
jgi:uncharacterized protein (DUF1697 family)